MSRLFVATLVRGADASLRKSLYRSALEVVYLPIPSLLRRTVAAIRAEVGRGRAVWELQNLLDDRESDDLVARRVGVRGELSLEHAFRLLSLVLEPEVVRAAFHGVVLDDERLKNFSLEYLEQVLPTDVRRRLWPFIGDVSQYQRERSMRPLSDVVSDLVKTGATLFAEGAHREALRRVLEEEREKED
ncbi:MAG: hypothetical protein GWN99_05425 [Gemmatimonadetes bacterium]|uniref:Uncharacterized protein n=1 Tax=Candidatus Kutchimonas denitrificans TaxID=3056748 RepID=A0AAE5CBP0_9BACT|nr:hypothetical protein [Gemmatimonadota bacterium]NIR76127.1 hypothetical protein [Candidatus Kutchimonas denitrificans]NIS00506.1 hypothetical protein [Gemmatimonadota bacterium]NIT66164.1 hypothetical protein [Gemmatimonadota bacterium]NIV22732.1 hypothetical protein [Gemmatimonadota bacterium]